jgi:ATP-dependent Clp protease ATP-binding subunit ClpC
MTEGSLKAYSPRAVMEQGRQRVFERYTIASRRAIFISRAEASRVGSPIIDTEHLLLGVLLLDRATLRAVAESLTAESVRSAATRWHEPRPMTPTSLDMPLGPEAQQVMVLAASIADRYKSQVIRSEHLLLALLTIPSSHAAIILEEAGADQSGLEEIVRVLPGDQAQSGDQGWMETMRESLLPGMAHGEIRAKLD